MSVLHVLLIFMQGLLCSQRSGGERTIVLHVPICSTLSRAVLLWQDDEEDVIWSDYEQSARPGDVVGLVRINSVQRSWCWPFSLRYTLSRRYWWH